MRRHFLRPRRGATSNASRICIPSATTAVTAGGSPVTDAAEPSSTILHPNRSSRSEGAFPLAREASAADLGGDGPPPAPRRHSPVAARDPACGTWQEVNCFTLGGTCVDLLVGIDPATRLIAGFELRARGVTPVCAGRVGGCHGKV